jgi:protein-disulfide isomerase
MRSFNVVNKTKILKPVLSFLAISALALGAYTQAQAAEEFTDAQKAAMNAMIEAYIKENPQIIMDSVEAFRIKQQEQAEETAAAKLNDHIAALTAKEQPSVGSENPDITVVEFFDYNCGYCKRAVPDIQKVLQDDPKVRFVFQEMPILGPTSGSAAKWALAAHKQGKYFDYHVALMNHKGAKEDADLENIAKELGLDVEKMKTDANSDEIAAMIAKSMEVSNDLGIRGTPAFIIGDEIVRGYLGENGLQKAIEDARARKG